jgi:glycosyltransferase involved in cell wall biosynthesis
LSRLSIACPAYNEATGINDVVRRWIDYLQHWRELHDFEVIICNDGSSDGTDRILECLHQQFPMVKPVHHAVNKGAAAALTTAIAHSTGDWVLLLDADGQFPIENLPRLWTAITDADADAAIGYRPRKEDTPFARLGSWASGYLCGCIYGRQLKDFNSALKLVRGPLLRSLTLEAKGLNYSTEVSGRLLELGAAVKIVETEGIHVPRRTGHSSRALVRGAWHRFLFVCYLGCRRFLQSQHVLQPPQDASTHRGHPYE